MPWIRRLLSECQIADDRIIPISRSGAGSWYGAKTCVELYALGRTPQEIRVQNRLLSMKTGAAKQREMTDFDRRILADVRETLKLTDPVVVHPSVFYRECEPFWHGERGFEWLARKMEWRFPFPTEAAPPGLPETFIAAKFYARSTWPIQRETTDCAKEILRKLSHDLPVVLLNTGAHVDEHVDYDPDLPNVTRLTDYATVTPENTLLLQSAVMAAARGFVGNYGGLAQLALCLRKPSASFYATWQGTAMAHRHLSTELSIRTGVHFVVHALTELPLLHAVIPPFQRPLAVAPEVAETV